MGEGLIWMGFVIKKRDVGPKWKNENKLGKKGSCSTMDYELKKKKKKGKVKKKYHEMEKNFHQKQHDGMCITDWYLNQDKDILWH